MAARQQSPCIGCPFPQQAQAGRAEWLRRLDMMAGEAVDRWKPHVQRVRPARFQPPALTTFGRPSPTATSIRWCWGLPAPCRVLESEGARYAVKAALALNLQVAAQQVSTASSIFYSRPCPERPDSQFDQRSPKTAGSRWKVAEKEKDNLLKTSASSGLQHGRRWAAKLVHAGSDYRLAGKAPIRGGLQPRRCGPTELFPSPICARGRRRTNTPQGNPPDHCLSGASKRRPNMQGRIPALRCEHLVRARTNDPFGGEGGVFQRNDETPSRRSQEGL